jgi:ribonuclease J
MTSLTFYGGANEIGGNKILLEERDARVFLDFGKSFSKEKMYFDEPWLKPSCEDDLLALGILPDLPRIYKKDGNGSPGVDAVIISHPHMDHFDSIRWLRDDIPIFSSQGTMDIILAREFCSRSQSAEYQIACLTKTRGEEIAKQLEKLHMGKVEKVAGLDVTALEVDHSVPGACGTIIETKEGSIVYSGDLRLHGVRADKTEQFIKKAKSHEPEVLIVEGTNVGSCKISSEKEVQGKLDRIVKDTKGLVVASFAVADQDRLDSFIKVAKANGRKMIITAKQAFMYESAHCSLKDIMKNTMIFRKEKKNTSAFEDYLFETYPDNVIDAEGVKKIQKKAILVASLPDMLALPTVDPVPGSVYVLSSSEPFNEEMELSYDKLMNWLTRFGLPLFQVHASGHANAHDLQEMIEKIRPKKVMPVHTENAKLYAKFIEKLGFDVVQPSEGEKLTI